MCHSILSLTAMFSASQCFQHQFQTLKENIHQTKMNKSWKSVKPPYCCKQGLQQPIYFFGGAFQTLSPRPTEHLVELVSVNLHEYTTFQPWVPSWKWFSVSFWTLFSQKTFNHDVVTLSYHHHTTTMPFRKGSESPSWYDTPRTFRCGIATPGHSGDAKTLQDGPSLVINGAIAPINSLFKR